MKKKRDLRVFRGISVRLAPEDEQRLDALAVRLDVPRAQVARLALAAGVASLEGEAEKRVA